MLQFGTIYSLKCLFRQLQATGQYLFVFVKWFKGSQSREMKVAILMVDF